MTYIIKPLSWTRINDNRYEADTICAYYSVVYDHDKWFVNYPTPEDNFETLEQAQNAAQAHWENRIKQALIEVK